MLIVHQTQNVQGIFSGTLLFFFILINIEEEVRGSQKIQEGKSFLIIFVDSS